MRGQPSISRVYEAGETPDPVCPLEMWGRIEHLRRRAWQKAGVVAVKPSELPAELAAQIEAWARGRYGARKT